MENTGQPGMEQLMNQLGLKANPKAQMVAQFLSQQKDRNKETELRKAKIKSARRKQQKTLRFFQRRNSEFAAACGACFCWGHPQCSVCKGKGRPGWQQPDEELFYEYIEPVLRRIGILADAIPETNTIKQED